MRVTSLTSFSISNYNNNNQNSPVKYNYFSNEMPFDSVSFGKKIKSKKAKKLAITVKEKVIKEIKVKEEPAKNPKRLSIKNSIYGEFNINTQEEMKNIHKNLGKINGLFDSISSNYTKINQMRQGYSKLVVIPKNSGITFKIDKDTTLTILQGKYKKNLVRLIVDEKDKSTHFLIDGYDKVASNLNKNTPQFTPQKLRYMTAAQIEESQVKKYITIANEELEKYNNYLMNFTTAGSLKPNPVKPQVVKTAKVAQQIKTPETKHTLENLLEIFEKTPEQIPQHLSPVVSPASGKVLGFYLKTKDGGQLKVYKKISSEYGKTLRYLSLEKTSVLGDKKYINIDLLNNEILKTNSITGKPMVINNFLRNYTSTEIERLKIKEDFAQYLDEIFASSQDVTSHQEVKVLELHKGKKEIKVEDFEDENITKLVEKEARQAEKNQQPAIQTEPPAKKEVRKKQPKAVKETPVETQPKTKVEAQTENPVEDLATRLEKVKQEAMTMATEDAKVFADTYFKTFVEQFKKDIATKTTDFMAKLDDLLK